MEQGSTQYPDATCQRYTKRSQVIHAILKARDLTKRYGDTLALGRLNLSVNAGEILCLLGANGAGKTTTINLFLGFTEPTSGKAMVGGATVATDPSAAQAMLGYVADVFALYSALTGAENLEFFHKA